MDRLDRLSIWAIVLLIIASCALIVGHVGEARLERGGPQRGALPEHAAPGPELASQVRLARNLMESESPARAEALVRDSLARYPYAGELHLLLGDILMRKQDVRGAVRSYREAVDLNPDYLDRKTGSFQGKKLKIAVNEALAEIGKRLERNPGDDALRQERKDIYYLQRKIAGGCS